MSIDNYVNGMSEGSQRRGSVKDKVYKRPFDLSGHLRTRYETGADVAAA